MYTQIRTKLIFEDIYLIDLRRIGSEKRKYLSISRFCGENTSNRRKIKPYNITVTGTIGKV